MLPALIVDVTINADDRATQDGGVLLGGKDNLGSLVGRGLLEAVQPVLMLLCGQLVSSSELNLDLTLELGDVLLGDRGSLTSLDALVVTFSNELSYVGT